VETNKLDDLFELAPAFSQSTTISSFTEEITQSRITIKLFQWIKSHWTSKWCS